MREVFWIILLLILLTACVGDSDTVKSSLGDCFNINDETLLSYNCGDSDIVIPEGVRVIAEGAMADKGLESVVFPESLETIEKNAFEGNNLESVDLPEGVSEIGEEAFKGNDAMELVHVPHENPEIGENAFPSHYIWGGTRDECFVMEVVDDKVAISEYRQQDVKERSCPREVRIPKGVGEIQRRAFADEGLLEVDIPETVEEIGEEAFKGNDAMELVHVPHENPEIGNNAFPGHYIWGGTRDECFVMEVVNDKIAISEYRQQDAKARDCPRDVVIPRGITQLKNNAFANGDLASVDIPMTVDDIGDSVFMGNSRMGVIQVPNRDARVGVGAFPVSPIFGGTRKDCFIFDTRNSMIITGYKERDEKGAGCPRAVEISKGVTRIQEGAFQQKRLTAVVILEGVTHIEVDAFANNHLALVIIPSSVVDIAARAFSGNIPLGLVHVPNPSTVVASGAFETPFIQGGSRASCFVWNVSGREVTLDACSDSDAIGHCPVDLSIPEGVSSIADNACGQKNLSGLVIPDTVTAIGAGAFSRNSFNAVTLPRCATYVAQELSNPSFDSDVVVTQEACSGFSLDKRKGAPF